MKQNKMSKALLTSVFLYNFLFMVQWIVGQWLSGSCGTLSTHITIFAAKHTLHILGKKINICVSV